MRIQHELYSPFADFGVLAFSTKCTDLKFYGTLLQREKKKREFGHLLAFTTHTLYAATVASPCQRHAVPAGELLSKAGC